MSLEIERKRIKAISPVTAAGTRTVNDADIIVPDYQPDAARVLQAEVLPMVSEKQVQNGFVTLSGSIDYSILYLSDEKGEERAVKPISARMPFTHRIEASGAEDGAPVQVCPDVIRVEFSQVNSRKINVKSVVDFRCRIEGNGELDAVCSVSADSPVPSRQTEVESFYVAAQCENFFEISDAIPLPQDGGVIDELLKADIAVNGREVKSINGKPVAKGEVEIRALYRDGGGDIRSVGGEIPFTEILDVDNVGESDTVRTSYSVTDFKYSAAADGNGDATLLKISASVSVYTYVYSQQAESITSDLYSPDFCVDISRGRAEIYRRAGVCSSRAGVKEIAEIPAGAPPIERIYGVNVKPYVEEAKLLGGKAHIRGTSDVYVTYITADSALPVFTFKKEIPFELNTPCDGGDSCELEAVCTPSAVHWAGASPRDIEIRFFLDFDVTALEKRQITYIENAEIGDGDADKKERAGIVIYFADKGESMWDIYKRYNTTEEDIAAANGTSFPDVLPESTKILVPKRR